MILNNVYVSDCVKFMQEMDAGSVDMILTSPPYDDLREYEGIEFNFVDVAKNMFRVLKDGAVVVWVVSDATNNGCESGTSFRQALEFMNIGFKLHDTMIYKKKSFPFPSNVRYLNGFEFMFVFVKGKLKTFNPIKDVRSSSSNHIGKLGGSRGKDGIIRPFILRSSTSMYIMRSNVWEYNQGYMKTTTDKVAYEHPAIFPDALAEDHIRSWTNIGDIVFDPFCGSGTTCKISKKLNRRFLGCDISKKYVEIAKQRISNTTVMLDDDGFMGNERYEVDE